MKDFYDVFVLTRDFSFDGLELAKAIQRTFERRGTPFPSGVLLALTAEFAGDASKQTQWKAFLRRSNIRDVSPHLEEIVATSAAFILTVFELPKTESEDRSWNP